MNANEKVTATFALRVATTAQLAIIPGQVIEGQIDLNGGAQSTLFALTAVATGGSVLSGYTWTATALQPLPNPAMFINSLEGFVSGHSATFARGTYTMFVTVRDDAGTSVNGSVTIDLTMTCSSNPAQFSPCSAAALNTLHGDYLPSAKVGAPYAATIIASGGTPPYQWTVFSGTLPPGMVLDGVRGVLRGTPTAAGVYDFFVKITDAAGGSNVSELNAGVLAARFSVTVNP